MLVLLVYLLMMVNQKIMMLINKIIHMLGKVDYTDL